MAQVIQLPNGSFYDNNIPWEDQSASAQTWITDNFVVWSQTYMFLGALWLSSMVALPLGYTGSWDNKKKSSTQIQDGELWYNDASPVFNKAVVWSRVNNTVDVVRGSGIYDNSQPLTSQSSTVQDYVAQSLDEARRLSVLQGIIPENILLPNAEIWDNNLPYSAQTAGAQTEADLLWSGGSNSGNKLVVGGVSFVDRKDNATWRLTISASGSQDYYIENI